MNTVPLGYRYLWAIVAAISAVAGVLLALFTLLVGAWITVLIFGALAGCAALHLLRENRPRTTVAWDYGTAAAWGAGIAVAMTGLIAAFGASGVALVAVLTVSSPPAIRWYRLRTGRFQRGRTHPAAGPAGRAPATSIGSAGSSPQSAAHLRAKVGALTDRQLIDAWGLSGNSLAGARSTAEIAQQVLGRSMILDEIQSRYPAGFESWISDGAPAGTDPSGYAQPTPEARGDDTD